MSVSLLPDDDDSDCEMALERNMVVATDHDHTTTKNAKQVKLQEVLYQVQCGGGIIKRRKKRKPK